MTLGGILDGCTDVLVFIRIFDTTFEIHLSVISLWKLLIVYVCLGVTFTISPTSQKHIETV